MHGPRVALIIALSMLAGCATTGRITAVKPPRVTRTEQKRAPEIKRVDYVKQAEQMTRQLNYAYKTTKALLRSLEGKSRRVRRLRRLLRRNKLNSRVVGKSLAKCFQAPLSTHDQQNSRSRLRKAAKLPQKLRRRTLRRLTLNALRTLPSRFAGCPQVTALKRLNRRTATPQIKALHGAFTEINLLRLGLRIDIPQRLAVLNNWHGQARKMRRELRTFRKTVIMPTFKDPELKGLPRKVARIKLRSVRRLDRQLSRLLRRIEREARRYPKLISRSIAKIQRGLARL